MLFRTFYHFIRFPRLSGISVPFKVYWKSHIHIGKKAKFYLKGRLKIGNDRKLPVVSLLPINLWFGDQSEIHFGKSVCIGPGVNIIVKEGAFFRVGDDVIFGSDLHIEGLNHIEIGESSGIGWGTTILDDDHHPIYYDGVSTNRQTREKVIIGKHVWVTNNIIILRGTEIGDNSVIIPGSVVKGKFPANSLIGGNPAKVIREGINWEWK